MAHSVYAVLALAVGLVGLGIGLGALWPRFAAIHPQEAATSPGGLLYMILSLGYLAAALALLIRPLGRHVLIGVLPDARFLPAGGAIWLAGVAALSALVAGLPLALGARALSRRDL
jgi:ABC-2 type transport system permease protein